MTKNKSKNQARPRNRIQVERSNTFKKQFQELPEGIQKATREAIAELSQNPSKPADSLQQVKCKIKGVNRKFGKVYFIHPNYRYRIAYAFDGESVYLIDVGSRENYYDRLKKRGQ